MKYRADIDGLRALAIIPVLFYHVGVPGFAGGFAGVDVFFVISGYLICGMIDADIASGSFSLGNFYKRRILRILPALFVMFLVTSILAYAYCLPVELKEYSKSLASAIGSVISTRRRRRSRCCTPGRWVSRSSFTSSSRY
jgi:peptidoglycan/LPS O-acetylase OafA/YrhL